MIPTIEEVQVFITGKFNNDNQYDQDNQDNKSLDKEDALMKACQLVQKYRSQVNFFEKGDLVKVIEGDLQNLIGVVVNTNKQEVTILPKMENITEQMSLNCSQLVKYFNEGDNVIITNDKFKGTQGKILKIDGFIAHLIVNNQQNQLRCPYPIFSRYAYNPSYSNK